MAASSQKRPAQGGADEQEARRSPGLLWFLDDQEALMRRFVLAEVLGPPRARRPAGSAPGRVRRLGRP